MSLVMLATQADALKHLEHAMPGVQAAPEACWVTWGLRDIHAGEVGWRVSLWKVSVFDNSTHEEGQ